jgi:hypothetical protein
MSTGRPVIAPIERVPDDPFLQQLNRSGHSSVVLTDDQYHPRLVVDADGLLRAARLNIELDFEPYRYCHLPILILDDAEPLGDIMLRLKFSDNEGVAHDGALAKDVVLAWTPDLRKIITGADILGCLLKGLIAMRSQAGLAGRFSRHDKPFQARSRKFQNLEDPVKQCAGPFSLPP